MTAAEPLPAVLLDLDGSLLDPAGEGSPRSRRPPRPWACRRRTRRSAPLHRPPVQDRLRRTARAEPFERPARRRGLSQEPTPPAVCMTSTSTRVCSTSSRTCLQQGSASRWPRPKQSPSACVLLHARLLKGFRSVHGATLDAAVRHKAPGRPAGLHQLEAPAGQAVLLGDRPHDAAGAGAPGTGCIGAGAGLRPDGRTASSRRPCRRQPTSRCAKTAEVDRPEQRPERQDQPRQHSAQSPAHRNSVPLFVAGADSLNHVDPPLASARADHPTRLRL